MPYKMQLRRLSNRLFKAVQSCVVCEVWLGKEFQIGTPGTEFGFLDHLGPGACQTGYEAQIAAQVMPPTPLPSQEHSVSVAEYGALFHCETPNASS